MDEDLLEFLTRSLQLEGIAPGSPAHQAFTDLETNFPDLTTPGPQVLQIFSLAVLFYSTNGTAWKDRSGWTGPNDPCLDWVGVVCTPDGTVTELQLARNDVLGFIPSEIQGLSQLGT